MDDFMGGGESLKFEKIGDTHSGKLISIESKVDTKPNGEVVLWPDGSQKKVFMWHLETDAVEDGQATLWVRGNMVKVLREAAAKAGAKKQADLIGATVMVKHHALGEPKIKGNAPAKLFQAKITLAPAEDRASEDYDPFA